MGEDNKKKCITCQKSKAPSDSNFYKSFSKWHSDGLYPICKKCLNDYIYKNEDDFSVICEIMRILDKPLKTNTWEQAKRSRKATLGEYFRLENLNSKYETYDDSDHLNNNNLDGEKDNKGKENNKSFTITDSLIDKWGVGYKPKLYGYFERKYNILKNNYQEKTSMHREGLLTYIRFRVQEELATANGDVKAAKEWGALASKAAQDAKINPSQLSKADLSDGLDTFGQLVRTVEQAEDIIPQLPQFKAKPQDSVDFTMWCYINYIRDLKGLPLAEYKDIYDFYEQRKKEYENRLDEGDDD